MAYRSGQSDPGPICKTPLFLVDAPAVLVRNLPYILVLLSHLSDVVAISMDWISPKGGAEMTWYRYPEGWFSDDFLQLVCFCLRRDSACSKAFPSNNQTLFLLASIRVTRLTRVAWSAVLSFRVFGHLQKLSRPTCPSDGVFDALFFPALSYRS